MVTKKRRLSPRQRRIYRGRRIIAALMLVLVLALLIFCIYSLGRGIFALGSAIGNRTGSSFSRAKVVKPGKHAGVRTCGADDVQLELSTKSAQVELGGSLDFAATIKHIGSANCLIDGSNGSRVLTITSGSDTIWKSDVCPVDSRMLLMAKGDKDVQTVTWNTERTGDTCVTDYALPKVDSGSYVAGLSMKDNPKIVSSKVTIVVQ